MAAKTFAVKSELHRAPGGMVWRVVMMGGVMRCMLEVEFSVPTRVFGKACA
jgi:hypothetical protein